MWENLDVNSKNKYKELIIKFASLSEAFTQKNDNSKIVTPIVNSKFQETVFQSSFNAIGEDIANTSFDASLIVDEQNKYLVGIKSFGKESGAQKIAQFKSSSASQGWGEIFLKISETAKKFNNKQEADIANHDNYLKLATEISKLRNIRIESHKEQIRGFNGNSTNVSSVYHVLMPSTKDGLPKIHVGETSYSPIDINNIVIQGCTNLKNPTNFNFTDGIHNYRYTSSDSQLYMIFDNNNIIVESWPIKYVKNPLKVFENIELSPSLKRDDSILESYSWVIYKENGTIYENSGFNSFDGRPKAPSGSREKRINKILTKYKRDLSDDQYQYVSSTLNQLIFDKSLNTKDYKKIRSKFLNDINTFGSIKLVEDIKSFILRPKKEVYIPLPNSKKFHTNNPDFFGKDIGLFKDDGKTLKLNKEDRVFQLEFLASGEIIKAFIAQESGKAIQSYESQQIMGEWILHKVFQLKDRELLTKNKLLELGINGIRLIKFKDPNKPIGIEFIWIDIENPPKDSIDWVAKNIKYSDGE
ncbi:hypothetical protein [Staphylococcus delphini]|uniref:hypothetical protein n=1 Tax=Staphylococcus delphini TaxID=53344 RepID=UPI0023B2FC2B|nr:hypothetical protein [Staphylococcus delphini]MDE9829487.1 hypothetical protein [Staphylococcus delphini]